MLWFVLAVVVSIATSPLLLWAQSGPPTEELLPKEATSDAVMVYKRVGEVELPIYLFRPADWNPHDRRSALVFFFGGGWSGGSVRRLMPFARYFADRGMVAACVEYRVKSRHGATPDQCLEDAKSAIRWLRAHAAEQGVDPHRIVASGDSAGGHLAASTALIEGFEASSEEVDVSSAADALVLFNPVLDAVEEEKRDGRVGSVELATRLSPTHHVRPGLPATLILHGTNDTRVPFRQAEEFAKKMEGAGDDVVLWKADGGEHSFWLRSPWRETVLPVIEDFLKERGFLPARADAGSNP